MSEEVFLSPISRDELVELWPKDESGALAARILFRFINWKLIQTASGAPVDDAKAGDGLGMQRALALLAIDFNLVVHPPNKAAVRVPTMQPLKRFSTDPKPNTKTDPKK
jgi:hypothetical protein